MKDIHEKIKNHHDFAILNTRINKILASIDYEIEKFRDNRASVIFTGNLHPSSLFTMASHVKYSDLTQGIQNVVFELNYIKDSFNLDLANDICIIFYEKFTDTALKFLNNLHTQYSDKLKQIIIYRFKENNIKSFQEMHKLVSNYDHIDNQEIINMIKIIIQIDPIFKALRENKAGQNLFQDSYSFHKTDYDELNFDFFDFAVKFIHKIYKQAFRAKDKIDDDNSNPNFKS